MKESRKFHVELFCLKFAQKCFKFEQTRDLFPLNTADDKNKRDHKTYHVVHATTGRLLNSAVPQMQRALNLDAYITFYC